jgi:hypothetical protein
VPFRPSGDRPVFCQECFSRRKAGNSFQTGVDNKPRQMTLTQIPAANKPQVVEKRKTSAKKKSVAKKKKGKPR